LPEPEHRYGRNFSPVKTEIHVKSGMAVLPEPVKGVLHAQRDPE
jgi:hypothetical protein